MKLGTLLIERTEDSSLEFYVISSPDCDTWLACGETLPEALEKLALRLRCEALRRYEADIRSLEG